MLGGSEIIFIKLDGSKGVVCAIVFTALTSLWILSKEIKKVNEKLDGVSIQMKELNEENERMRRGIIESMQDASKDSIDDALGNWWRTEGIGHGTPPSSSPPSSATSPRRPR